MSVTDEYLANNATYAASFEGPLPPSRHVAVVACMDARLNVYAALGIREGEAHVIRNAGDAVTENEIRSLAISQRLLGTREIVLVHHTDRGMLTFSDDAFRQRIEEGDGHPTAVGSGGVRRRRAGRATVGAADQGQPVRAPHGRRARLRLRRGDGAAQRGEVSTAPERECPGR